MTTFPTREPFHAVCYVLDVCSRGEVVAAGTVGAEVVKGLKERGGKKGRKGSRRRAAGHKGFVLFAGVVGSGGG